MTIRMIAEKCGCSPATVSKALNGADDVSRETAERIRRVAAETGYLPNAAARAMRTSRSYCFGVLFRDSDGNDSVMTHEFFSRILHGFKRRAEELGYDIFYISDHLGRRRIDYVEHARYRNCDGVLIANTRFESPETRALVDSGIPVVTIDYVFDTCGSVQSDNFQGMRDLVRYVYTQGHRDIALIYGEDTGVTRARLSSFRQTCRDLGLEIPEEYMIAADYHSPEASEEATRRLLALTKRPTCILYPDDISYIGGRNEIYRQNLRIPEDVSATGYDGIDLSQILRPRLATLKQNADLMGSSAADELVRAVDEGKNYVPGRIIIPGAVLPGETLRRMAP